LNHITTSLDKIASHLEYLGMVKEAHDLDVVSNTIEAEDFSDSDKEYAISESIDIANIVMRKLMSNPPAKTAILKVFGMHSDDDLPEFKPENLDHVDMSKWADDIEKASESIKFISPKDSQALSKAARIMRSKT